ncbi:hypothetical protein QOT17_021789 [Balamuthia mandrillaris]
MHIMEATAALDTLHEQLHKAQQEYLDILQHSFQLELNIPSCPETKCYIDNFVVFLASTSATLAHTFALSQKVKPFNSGRT